MAITEKISKEKAKEKPEKYIYVGPNLKSGKLVKYSIYKGMPTHLDDLFEQNIWLKQLFVKISDLAIAEKEIAINGTPKNKYYIMAQEV